MKKILFFISAVFFAFPLGQLSAETPQTVQLRIEANPRTILIGDVVKVEIGVVTSSSIVSTPFKPPVPMGEFEIRSLSSSQAQKMDNGKISLTHTLFLTTFSTGTQTLPALTLSFQSADGTLSEAKTEEIKIEVKSLLTEKGDEGGLRPLKGLYNFTSYLWLWILLAIATGAGVIYWFIAYRKKHKGLEKLHSGPPVPPEEWAWTNLQKLEDSDLVEKGLIKEYYIRLSSILREYLERRYQISALERTSAELLADFRKMNLNLQLTALLRDFLETGDLVKFAKWSPGVEEIEKDLNRVKEAVTLTTPILEKISEKSRKEIPV